ncbi:MAG: hypothetical protein PHQ43_00770 [Dehalococcoidales bacterium]|nr:hypothetical protein [Dehalococcoidales bacterium]
MDRRDVLVILIAVTAGVLGFLVSSATTDLGVNPLVSETEQVVGESDYAPVSTDTLRLEDRFANLMESLSDNGTLRYDVDIEAVLHESDDLPDTVTVTLRLREGQAVW